jgi:hypothetical protein
MPLPDAHGCVRQHIDMSVTAKNKSPFDLEAFLATTTAAEPSRTTRRAPLSSRKAIVCRGFLYPKWNLQRDGSIRAGKGSCGRIA